MKLLSQFKKVFSQDKELKLSMIRREMVTDCFQSGFKFLAYSVSGSQALKAEMYRSFIDVISHAFRISASYSSTYKPDDKYNYGYNLARHLTIMTPGNFFMCSGVYLAFSSLTHLITLSSSAALTLNPLSLSAIAFTSIGEFYLYYKNLGDLNQDNSQSIFKRLYSRSQLSSAIFNKNYNSGMIKDTVVIENIYSVASSSVAVLSTLAAYSTGLLWIDSLGLGINGLIQIKIGQRTSDSNSKILILSALSKNDCERVINVILSNKEIEKVENFKSSWSVEQIRISAEIKLNRQILAMTSLKLLEKDLKNIEVDQKELKSLLVKFIYSALTKSVEVCKFTENKIKETYEFAKIIDIEKGDGSEDPEKIKIVQKAVDEVLASVDARSQSK